MISGKSFADKCHWIFDNRYPERRIFDYSRASSGDWVFINGDFLYEFLNRVPLFADKKFTFIIHNSDQSFDEAKLQRLLRFANHIYAINTTVKHPLLTTIPIGFVDKQLPFLQSFQHPKCERDIEIYMNFTMNTNIEKRKECASIFENDPRVVQRSNVSVPEYYSDLCRSKYVLCPEGTGIDTHRVYEALFCGATPVVLRNTLSQLYETLPVCIVNKWTDPFYIPSSGSFDARIESYLYVLSGNTTMKLFETRLRMIETLVPKNGNYAEIGVFEGMFSLQIIKSLEPSRFHMIDIFSGWCDSGNEDGNNVVKRDMDKEYIRLLKETYNNPCIRIMKGKSKEMMSTFPDNSLDMVYIDGDHSYEGCKQDLEVSYLKVKPGGWIMGHDYEMNRLKTAYLYDFGVKKAVDEFCETYAQTIHAKGLDGCVSFAIQVNKAS
jgi:hypothetical protein